MEYTASEQRYETMKYRRVGKSGLLFPILFPDKNRIFFNNVSNFYICFFPNVYLQCASSRNVFLPQMEYTASEQRYETMKYRRVGKSGLLFPILSLGYSGP